MLNSCGGLQEAGKVLRNEKKNTTDEFLVKKKEPLVLPPDYNNIPTPDSLSKKDTDEQKLKNILNAPKKDENKKSKSSSTQESILEKIRK